MEESPFISLSMDAQNFFKRADFTISSLSLIMGSPPSVSQWDSCVSKLDPLISKRASELIFNESKVRYQKFYSCLQTHIDNKLFLLVLAESLFWLSAYCESLELLMKLDTLLDGDDELLKHIIRNISQIIENARVEDEKTYNLKGTVSTSMYSSPLPIPSVQPDEGKIAPIREAWNDLQSKEKEAIDQFSRYACVTSNLLEDVFQIEGQSWARLVRRGFYVNSIEGISKNSKMKMGSKIIQILKNTQESLQSISKCLNDTNTFTPEFIKSLHRTILKDDNFDETQLVETYNVIRLISIGNFRKGVCFTNHGESENEEEYCHITMFCHHTRIEQEILSYCKKARKILKSGLDPFVQAAWLQWAFLRIHPFEDGNGRVGRIISSIPLSKARLPPVVVPTTCKLDRYFEALRVADEMKEGYLKDLVEFLYETTSAGIEEIKNLPTPPPLGKSRVPRPPPGSTHFLSS
eukprot:TRINITY_DN2497_c0_g1_i1.p1 TRINITY_DN2497_c0_g1~~TRINITY_DN2497_c0_g1_i1.p1  ORF type:complete len:464 (-),score=36.66 TRINITY_DN2497_c0_g1_i1:23-1414(-)